MYGALHISESVARLSVAGVVLWLSLSLGLATAVGVGAWTLGHEAGAGYSPAHVTELQRQAFVRGVAAGSERRVRGARTSTRTLGRVRQTSYEHGYAAGYRAASAAP
jgi:hypothetical protein